jgi:cyanuric acid amidohydrolase
MKSRAFAFATRSPSDVAELARMLDDNVFAASDVVCILGKTEGNGGRNDFTRELAMTALEQLFAPRLGCRPEQVQERVIFSFSGGTEGVVSPHMLVLVKEGEPASVAHVSQKRLAVGIGRTRDFAPHEIGTMAQIQETARAIQTIVASLQVDDLADVHLVQMKGAIPHFSHEQAEAARKAGKPFTCDMVYSRAASALGTALALDEVAAEALSDQVVCQDYSLYSSVASCSAKPGLAHTEILLFANSRYWDGDLEIQHGVLQDILDVHGIHQVAAKLGMALEVPPNPAHLARLVGVFAKSEADASGQIRGQRHTMWSDDDISDTRYSRCVLSSVLASVLGTTRVYVSTRAEHHGPPGGGPLAILARCASSS